MATIPGRTTYAWKQIVKRLRETATHCAKCGYALNNDLKWPHPYSTTGGHIKSWHDHPELRDDPSNAQAEHLRCNTREGAEMTNRRTRGRRVSRSNAQSYTNPNW